MKPIALILTATLSLVQAADIKVTGHDDRIIQVALLNPTRSDIHDSAISPDSDTLLLRSARSFRLIALDRPLTAERIESAPAHDGRALGFLPDSSLVASCEDGTKLFRHDAPPRKVLAKPIDAHPYETFDLVATVSWCRRKPARG
jgi:hypothetical protein